MVIIQKRIKILIYIKNKLYIYNIERMNTEINKKICKKCNQEKDETEYYIIKRNKKGIPNRRRECKGCFKKTHEKLLNKNAVINLRRKANKLYNICPELFTKKPDF